MAKSRPKKKFPYGWTTEKAHEYFVKLAKDIGQPFGIRKIPLEASDIPQGAFISYSYGDESSKDLLREVLPVGANPIVWPAIEVPPTEYVSAPLIEAVRSASALVYVAEGRATQSFWVAFERDVALRADKPVFAFYPSRRAFVAERDRPASRLIHGLYGAADLPVAETLIDWMAANRNFRVEKFSPFDWNDIGEYADDISEFGGLFLAVVGRDTIRELPLQNLRLACESEDFWPPAQRLIMACLDPPDLWIPKHIRQYVMEHGEVDLTDGGSLRPWSARKVDDLITRIVWLTG